MKRCCAANRIHSMIHFSIASDSVGIYRPVDAVQKLCRHEVAQVLRSFRCGVFVVVAAFSVVAEAVGVLQTQVQTLDTQQTNDWNQHKAACWDLLQMRECLLTESLDTITDWKMSGALTSK